MSPMCSIMAAMAMGAMTKMEVRSNLARKKGWMPTGAAEARPEKSMRGTTLPAASRAVAPMALAIRATT